MNHLYYGDNLEVLRKYIRDESIDLCYIDPPFNSKRNYNQIYNNLGKEDLAQSQAFMDTWTWDKLAEKGFGEIIDNNRGIFTHQTIKLILGLRSVLNESSLIAYLISITLRVAEIYRALKPTGSFFFHCDPTSSHYIKLVLDSIFLPNGGEFQNEITWKRAFAHCDTKQGMKRCGNIKDNIFFYTKSKNYNWNTIFTEYKLDYLDSEYRHVDKDGRNYKQTDLTAAKPGGDTSYEWRVKRELKEESNWIADLNDDYLNPDPNWQYKGVTPYRNRYWAYSKENMIQFAIQGKLFHRKTGMPRLKQYSEEMVGIPLQNIWDDIPPLTTHDKERLGYPTQKPEALLERIIKVSSNEGDVILDAYCGCGTTVAVAQKLNRKWIGIDITYQSISLILKRLEDSHGSTVLNAVNLSGIPKDIRSAEELAVKKDDRVRKEFEKWAVLTYSQNRAAINQKKGSDHGIDGWGFFPITDKQFGRIVFQVKSGKVGSKDIRDLLGTITREKAELGIFITLQTPTKDMVKEAKAYGLYHYDLMNQDIPKIQIVTIQEILEKEVRLSLPLVAGVLKSSPRHNDSDSSQLEMLVG